MQICDAILETYRAAVPTVNKTTGKSFMANLIKYALPILIYERIALPYTRPAAYLLFTYLTIHATIDTSILNMIASKKTLQIKGCDCTEKQIIRASLASPFYYIGNILFLNLLYFIPYIGIVLYWILYPTLYGFAVLEFYLAGMCTRHRYKYFGAIMPYCFGIGLCIHGLTMIICHLLMINNPFFYIAVLNVIYTQVIMNGRFCPKETIELPTPFHLSRAATSYVISNAGKRIIDGLEKEEIQIPFILEVWNKSKWIMGKDFETLDSFLSRDVCKYLILEHENKIKSTLDTLIEVSRQTNVIWFIDYFGDIIPDFIVSEKTSIALKILKREGMTDNLIYLRGLFNDIAYESTTTIFDDVNIIEDHFRAMSRSPSVEFEEYDDFMVLKFPKQN